MKKEAYKSYKASLQERKIEKEDIECKRLDNREKDKEREKKELAKFVESLSKRKSLTVEKVNTNKKRKNVQDDKKRKVIKNFQKLTSAEDARYSVVGGLEGFHGKMRDTTWREDGRQWWEDGR